ncbi:UDP-N-acetylmuramate--L-alanine ligase [Miltoncostaea oceani]|uniref:UDP-N-acetylmuramate--L-alanine ligase n=1 Tax=Miltoncostaea oceani TaxID=2843216 RepID=UPI001C3D5577|nr:UDP-N-acetylmuramate--L-alanine ligase [Miltoncostaea oceani]
MSPGGTATPGPRRIHLVGIGGAGMSALARLAQAAGYRVAGSDREASATLDALRSEDIDARVGHAAESLGADADALVVSTAIADDNPELVAARRRGLPVLHRSELLAELMAGRRGLAVAGAHGKSTTSAMLHAALGDASACVGATIAGGNGTGAVWGTGPWFVAEADESDRSLLNLRPEAAILLNVDHDHHATYASLDEVRDVFRTFVAALPPDGCLVVGPDADARACADAAPCPVRVVGDVPGAFCRVERPGAGGFTLVLADGRRVDVPLGVAGLHNAENAACALALADWCGVPPDVAAGRLAGFTGVGRRMDPRGVAGGVEVVDDYAHHPAEIRATLQAARERGAGRVLVVFQPHLPSRTRALGPELATALGAADVVVVTDVYLAREPADPAVTGRAVVEAVPPPARAVFAATLAEARDVLLAEARPGDLILTMGAGDVTTLGQELVARLGNTSPDGSTHERTGPA